jgi:hypothetical protein
MNIRSALSISAAMQMALLVLTASVLFSQDSDSNTAKSLPTAQQVMDRYVTALGGRDSIFEHKSMTVRGTFEVSEKGPRLDRSAYYKSGKMLYEVTLPNGSPTRKATTELLPGNSILRAAPPSRKARRLSRSREMLTWPILPMSSITSVRWRSLVSPTSRVTPAIT